MYLTERVTTLENEVDMSSYPIILCDELDIPTYLIDASFLVIKQVDWRCKLNVGFQHDRNDKYITAFLRMENEKTKAPPVKWPFQGRFKLTIIDKKYKSSIYESDLIKLQPENVLKDKGRYPSDFTMVNFPFEYPRKNFFDTKLKFILQAQEIWNQ